MLPGKVIDDDGVLDGKVFSGDGVQRLVQRLVQRSCLIVPDLRCNLFSVKQATLNGVEFIFDMNNPGLEANNVALPLQELGRDFYSSRWIYPTGAVRRSWQRRLREVPSCCIGGWDTSTLRTWTS